MRLKCITLDLRQSSYQAAGITIGNSYDILDYITPANSLVKINREVKEDFYLIINEYGTAGIYSTYLFQPKYEYRQQQIDKILENES